MSKFSLLFSIFFVATSCSAGTLKECWSVHITATDQWCIDICLHTPPYCPASHCKCRGHSSCYADDPTPYRKFGLATSYLVNANLDTTEISVPGCKPVMLYLLTRHGTRGPRHSKIEAMMEKLPGIKQAILEAWADGKSKMCQKDVMHLKKWSFPYPADEDQSLQEAGRKEMRQLGKRFGKRFPDLLKDSQNTVRKSSDDPRSHDSMDAFLRGLYGHQVDFEDSTDDMFTYYKICPAFYQRLKNFTSSFYVEMNKLEDSEAYEKMVEEISYRIGVQLNKEQLNLAYRICGFEIANDPNKVSPWCALFSEGDMRLIEYSFNLENYYQYHPNISWQMTQPLMADLQKKLFSLRRENNTWYNYNNVEVTITTDANVREQNRNGYVFMYSQ